MVYVWPLAAARFEQSQLRGVEKMFTCLPGVSETMVLRTRPLGVHPFGLLTPPGGTMST